MASLFNIAAAWESISEEEREPLRSRIAKLVGYPCKLSCQPNDGVIDIYILSVKSNRVTDWIEIQPNGALGALFELYPMNKQPNRLSDACEDYNGMIGAEFVSESEGEGEEEGQEEGEEESEDDASDSNYKKKTE